MDGSPDEAMVEVTVTGVDIVVVDVYVTAAEG
jgi:hypothetical protein